MTTTLIMISHIGRLVFQSLMRRTSLTARKKVVFGFYWSLLGCSQLRLCRCNNNNNQQQPTTTNNNQQQPTTTNNNQQPTTTTTTTTNNNNQQPTTTATTTTTTTTTNNNNNNNNNNHQKHSHFASTKVDEPRPEACLTPPAA